MFVTVKARVYTDVTGAYAELPALPSLISVDCDLGGLRMDLYVAQ